MVLGSMQIGSQARLMSLALRKVAANASKSGCTILFINQLRFKVQTDYMLCIIEFALMLLKPSSPAEATVSMCSCYCMTLVSGWDRQHIDSPALA